MTEQGTFRSPASGFLHVSSQPSRDTEGNILEDRPPMVSEVDLTEGEFSYRSPRSVRRRHQDSLSDFEEGREESYPTTYTGTSRGIRESRQGLLQAIEESSDEVGGPVTLTQAAMYGIKHDIEVPVGLTGLDVFGHRDRTYRHALQLAKQGRIKMWKEGSIFYVESV